MKTFRGVLLLAFASLTAFAQTNPPRVEWFRGFKLEEAARGANLIMAAEIIEVREVKSTFAGKSARITNHEYRLKPAQILKGIFARDEMTLTDSDLEVGANALRQGSFILLFLGRSEMGYRNSNGLSSDSNEQSIPPLRGLDDPLLEATRVFLSVNAATDRVRRVELLLNGLRKADGAGAVALLESLRPRALFVAQNSGAIAILANFLGSPSSAVREAAADTLADVLHSDYLENDKLRSAAASALVATLQNKSTNIAARCSAYHAVAALGKPGHDDKTVTDILLKESAGESLEEEEARVRAIGSLRLEAAEPHELARYRTLPLDASLSFEQAAASTAASLDAPAAASVIRDRLAAKLDAGLGVEAEIQAAGALPPEIAIPLLIDLWKSPLNAYERQTFASVCRKICVDNHHPDPRFIEPLQTMLSPSFQGREESISALRAIDTNEAAAALKPHLVEEANLGVKLAMAEMLGRHGIGDGFPYAMEHLSEPWLLDGAIKALAAIQKSGAGPDARPQLKNILETSNDTGWNSAAIRALGGLGATDLSPKFLELAGDFRNPLAIPALLGLADLGEPKVVGLIINGLNSRNDRIVRAAAQAAAKLARVKPQLISEDLRSAVAALISDAQAEEDARNLALDALLTLKEPRVNEILTKVSRETALENTELMRRIERLLAERKISVG